MVLVKDPLEEDHAGQEYPGRHPVARYGTETSHSATDEWAEAPLVQAAKRTFHAVKKGWEEWDGANQSPTPTPGQTASIPSTAAAHTPGRRPVQRYSGQSRSVGVFDVLAALAHGTWWLIAGGVLVISAIVAIYNHFNGLTEHSTCSKYEQATTAQQYAVVEKMEKAHSTANSDSYDTDNPLGVASVNLFCLTYPNQPIDGVYNGNL